MKLIKWFLYLGHKGKHYIGRHKRCKKKTVYTYIGHEQQAGNQ